MNSNSDVGLFSKYPEIDWKGAKGIRDIISHHYFDLNADIVFAVCKDRLPGLMRVISEMKNSKDGRPS